MTNPDSHSSELTAGSADDHDPLAFTPVPRRSNRADGLHADLQRSFIQVLSHCGSPRRAAAAVGKASNGFEQLRRAHGAESFNAAWDAAIATFKAEEARRCAASAEIVRDEAAAWTPARGAWGHAASRARPQPPAPKPEESPADRREWLQRILRKYLLKAQSERKARLDGRVVEADFYLRQMTWLEVVLDLVSGDALALLADYRIAGHSLIDIAETPASRILGAARRLVWAEAGEPARPEHPPRDRLVDHGRFSTEPGEAATGGSWPEIKDQWREFEEQHARDAVEQVRWEAAARQEHDRHRAPTPYHDRETGSAGQPRSESED